MVDDFIVVSGSFNKKTVFILRISPSFPTENLIF